MKALRRFAARLLSSVTRQGDEARLQEELEAHLSMQTTDNVRAGLPPVEASRQARLKFGSVEAARAEYRAGQRLPILDDLFQDVRHTFRYLRRAPLFTVTVTVSLAMGIGANAAVFTVAERVLLRPLPVSDPDELVYITDERILTQPSPRFSYPLYAAIRDSNVLVGVAARAGVALNAAVNGHVLRISGELVSGSYFGVLGVAAQIGRPLSALDDRAPGMHPVAVISDGFWQRALAADPEVVGRELPLNGQTFAIVGVAAEGFAGTDVGSPTDIWIPMMMQREVGRDLMADARTNWLEMVGRLRSGMRPERAASELTRDVGRRAPELQARLAGRRVLLVSGERGNSPVRAELGPALAILMVLAVLALGLACVNVGSLVAVRAAARRKEVAIRLALGAKRSRLQRQLLTEGMILATLGGAAGLLVAPAAARLLVASQPRPLGIDLGLDIRVFAFALVASVLAGVVIAQAPMLASGSVKLTDAFDSASAVFARTARRLSAHDAIVTLQIAMALAMLISAALLVQSLRSFNSVDPGFQADNLLLATLDPKAAGYDADRIEGFWRETLARVSQIPGVDSVSLARIVPFAFGRQRQHWLNPSSGEMLLDTNFVGPEYFRTLNIALLSGREFDEQDGKSSRPVVVVNERFARMFWPGRDPIGTGIRLPDSGNPVAEVVGVVRDAKYRDLRAETGPMIYRPVFQTYSTDAMTLHLRTAADRGAVVAQVRAEVQMLNPNVPLFQVTTLEEHLDGSFAQTRQAAVLTTVFGLLALLLSGIGVYGVTALAVSRRTRDLGIRMALGAQRLDIIRAIGVRGGVTVVAGLVLGLFGSFGITRITGTLLFGITSADVDTFVATVALLALVCLIAFSLPVRAATRLDAVKAIRHE